MSVILYRIHAPFDIISNVLPQRNFRNCFKPRFGDTHKEYTANTESEGGSFHAQSYHVPRATLSRPPPPLHTHNTILASTPFRYLFARISIKESLHHHFRIMSSVALTVSFSFSSPSSPTVTHIRENKKSPSNWSTNKYRQNLNNIMQK